MKTLPGTEEQFPTDVSGKRAAFVARADAMLNFLRLATAICCLTLGITHKASAAGPVVINELHYHPDRKTEPAEFVELVNTSPEPVSLKGWSFTRGIHYPFPDDAVIAPGGHLVVAEDPAFLHKKFGVTALGPYRGHISSKGERLTLCDATGKVVNQVAFRTGFPWPVVGGKPGYSIELLNPLFDNAFGGNWRASVAGNFPPTSASTPGANVAALIPQRAPWRLFKGTRAASQPASAWRDPGFADLQWPLVSLPAGYGENFLATRLDDMKGRYSAVYFRRAFVVENLAAITALQLDALYDDGFNVWINGTHVLGENVPGPEPPFNATAPSAREDLTYHTFDLPAPRSYLRRGTNVIAVHALNSSLRESSDFYFDARLRAAAGGFARGPTPGAPNAVFTTAAPPVFHSVTHLPQQPKSGEAVRLVAHLTSTGALSNVTALVQLVNPGNYIELTDPAYQTNWTAVPMRDDGRDGDASAGDGRFTALLPAKLQTHRRLVRYRITATDAAGRSVTAPYADDPQPNFAYFVYDGVPAWRAAIEPGGRDPKRAAVTTFSADTLRQVPAYHLIGKKSAVEGATWTEKYGGDAYKWLGTLVYDGHVYDHIHYRARGGGWRYAMGKTMWKFAFNRGHDLAARDNYGRPYDTKWTRLNLGACIQQGNYGHRGEQGLFESAGFKLFNLAGLESPATHFVHFRVITDAVEANPANQFEGDFWGLYLAVEQPGGRFLDEHDLPDGNFYKMVGGSGELNNQGPRAASDKSDLNQFLRTYTGTRPTDDWWRANLDLPRYFNYRAVVEAIHHYDIDEGAGKNYFYYLNPQTARWSVHPWDLDLTWADSMYGGGQDSFRDRVLPRPAFNREYQNRVRELRDLLLNDDEGWRVIDDLAALIHRGQSSFVDADRAKWDFHPALVKHSHSGNGGHGRFYQAAPTKDFAGMVRLMKDYLKRRGAWMDTTLANDKAIPTTPAVTAIGPPDFPRKHLQFRCAPYAGANPFAALQWRLGEIAPAAAPATAPKYEVTAVWESAALTTFNPDLTLPPDAVTAGHTYRLRARFQDTTGRWGHWSAPVPFTVKRGK